MIKFNILIVGILLLAGCENDIPDFERTNFKIKGQEFEILSTKGIFNNYVNKYKNYKDFSQASEKLIFNPIEREILKDAEAPFMINSIRIPYELTENFGKQISLPGTSEVIDVIKMSLYSITDLLPGPDIKIIILPTSTIIQETLEKYKMPGYGVTIGSGKIIIAINQTSPNWKEFLSYAIAHEYHHSTWTSRNWISSDFSLVGYLIFEGRADAFAVSLNNNIEIPAAKFITPDQESVVWDMIKPELNMKGSDRIIKVMFGDDEIPYGSGYTIGYGIVKAFRENNPDYSDLEIIDMMPDKILKLSGYKN